MENAINLPAIFIANAIGVVLLLSIVAGNMWRLKIKTAQNRILLIMFFTSLTCCMIDPICFYADGKPGFINYCIVFGCNTYLYVMTIVLGYSWLRFVASFSKIRLHIIHKGVIFTVFAVGIILLVVNFFTPIVFSVNEQNAYVRGPLFTYYGIFQILFLIDGIILYYLARYRGTVTRFFPVWSFIIPASIGIAIQMLTYGVSTIWPFIAVSVSAVTFSVQNELLFVDKLTGLYNRFYLQFIESSARSSSDAHYTIIMADLNGFKSINDNFGHKTGDRALVEAATCIAKGTGDDGEVIRYAGDEFLITMPASGEEHTRHIIDRINAELDKVNAQPGKKYQLSLAYGFYTLNLSEYSIDELLDAADTQMYEDKRKYYERHPEYDRRSES